MHNCRNGTRQNGGGDTLALQTGAIVESWAFIYVRPASNGAVDRLEIERDGVHTTVVAVPEQSAAVETAVELVSGGVQVIELCGSLGPVWAARVIGATGGRVPVGAVSYGPESVALFLGWDPSRAAGEMACRRMRE
jgi:Family of unknown function (DUF6506)